MAALEVQWFAMKYGPIFIGRVLREFWFWVSWKLRVAFFAGRNRFVRRVRELAPVAFEVLSTFWVEAAVLILVFPPLEFFLARRNGNDNPQLIIGARPVGMVLVWWWSVILCVASLVASVKCAEWSGRRDRGTDKEN
jgi:hypothetical protein